MCGFAVKVWASMRQSPPDREGTTLRAIRRLLAASLAVGMLGTGAELLLIGHYESATQVAPIALIGIGITSFVWHVAAPGASAVRVVRSVMVAFTILGGIGVALHATGNKAFELEMYPSRTGWDLAWKTMTGATPVLAPGAITLLGLIGLALTHRHPAAGKATPDTTGVIRS
jgi:hypothetical protein